MEQKHITVFGSSRTKPGTELYRTVRRLGTELAAAGFGVISGGYGGTMEAVSRGANEEGGIALGILVDFWGRDDGNAWLTDSETVSTLYERLDRLITRADGYVFLPGGTGTLVELSLVWEMINKKMMSSKPACCYSTYWKPLLTLLDSAPDDVTAPVSALALFDTVEDIIRYFKAELHGA